MPGSAHRAEVALERRVQQQQVPRPVLAPGPLGQQPSEGVPQRRDFARHPPLEPVVQHLVEGGHGGRVAGLLGDPFGRLDDEVEVGARVDRLEDPPVVLDVVGQLGEVQRGRGDGVLEPGELLGREAAGLLQDAPVVGQIARLQEGDVGARDGDVVGGRVLVELLVPLLEEFAVDAGAVALLDAVPARERGRGYRGPGLDFLYPSASKKGEK